MKLRSHARLLFFMALILFAATGLAFAACQKGDKADVLWKGAWHPATVLHNNGERCFIHYDGYESSWDEWVGPDRIRIKGAKQQTAPKGPPPGGFQENEPVQVLWKGAWYDARVLKTKGAQTYIHYEGYESSWDEWVNPDRIRPRAGATPPTPPPPPPPPASGPPPAGPPPAGAPSGFNSANYTCSQFMADSQAKSPAAAQAIDAAIAYFGKRSGKSIAGMDANARMGFEMAFGMECQGAPQATWDAIMQRVYESSK